MLFNSSRLLRYETCNVGNKSFGGSDMKNFVFHFQDCTVYALDMSDYSFRTENVYLLLLCLTLFDQISEWRVFSGLNVI